MSDNKIYNRAVGIDLGTTTSCVAYYENNEVEIILNEQGNGTTPSFVAYSGNDILVGEAAKEQQLVNAENTIYDGKRLIGRKFDDPEIQNDLKIWPFKVVNNNNSIKVEVTFKGKTKQVFPEEIASNILIKLTDIAKYQIGEVKDAVITVPAYFSDLQRQATKDAGRIAGLNVLRLISEPTAAAIAYGLDRVSDQARHVLVYDLGGGTFDVSVLFVENGIFKVKATNGDTHLGGEDFDRRLVEYFAEAFKKDYHKDLLGNQNALARLRSKAKEAKEALTRLSVYDLKIQNLDGVDFQCEITRETFEKMNKDLFEKTIDCVKSTVKMSSLEIQDIDDIVLVGGSSRIPKIQDMITQCFDGKKPSKGIHPDEAVARGAAIMASVMSEDRSKKSQDIVFYDVLPLSLGLETLDGTMSVLLPRNMSLPATKTKRYPTSFDQQVAALITYANFVGLLSPEEIQRLISEAEEHRIEDEEELRRVKSKNKFHSLAYNLRSYVNRDVLYINPAGDLWSKCNAAIEWIAENRNATQYEYGLQLQSLMDACQTEDINPKEVIGGTIMFTKEDAPVLTMD